MYVRFFWKNNLADNLSKDSDEFKISSLRDKVEEKIIQLSLVKKIPILGICRGMQLLSLFFGGNLKKIDTFLNHNSEEHDVLFVNSNLSFFADIDKIKVKSYHKYGVNETGPDLVSLGESSDSFVECFKHKDYNIYGMMWHPEREVLVESNRKYYEFLFHNIIEG